MHSVILYSGGEKIVLDPNMIKLAEKNIRVKYEKGTDEQKSKIHANAKELYLATVFFWVLTSIDLVDSLKAQRTKLHPKCKPIP